MSSLYYKDAANLAPILAGLAVFFFTLAIFFLISTIQSVAQLPESVWQFLKSRHALKRLRKPPTLLKRLDIKPSSLLARLVDGLGLHSWFEAEAIRVKLRMAGIYGQTPLYIFLLSCFLTSTIFLTLAVVYVFLLAADSYTLAAKILIPLACFTAGAYGPLYAVTILVKRRQHELRKAFPDALDMLLICIRSGMTLQAALVRVATEISPYSKVVAQEFSLTAAELAYHRDRSRAFENLAARTTLVGVQAVAAALGQAERYGISVSQALRSTAKEYRDLRVQEAERKAASLPAKLTLPLVLFFLPVLFIVILGPAIIRMTGAQ